MSEIANALIRQAKAEHWKRLDLGRCGIIGTVPNGVGELDKLEELVLSDAWWDWGKGERVYCYGDGPANKITHLPATLPAGLKILSADETQLEDIGPLTGLHSLEVLRLRDTRVADLSPLLGAKVLRKLDVEGTLVEDLQPLRLLGRLQKLFVQRTKLRNLEPLKDLRGLQVLCIQETAVVDLFPLAHLKNLKKLVVHTTGVQDLGPLAGMDGLETLNVHDTLVQDLRPLSALSGLQNLYLQRTKVLDLQPLAALENLRKLYLQETPVTNLYPLKGLIEGLGVVSLSDNYGVGIAIAGCPILNPPLEIVMRGANAILDYWEQREIQGSIPIYESKLLVVGEPGVGKTTLLRRLFFPQMGMARPDESTQGLDIRRYNYPIDEYRKMTLNIWDIGNQEIFHNTHQFFLSKRSIYVLVVDASKTEAVWEGSRVKAWLETIALLGGDSPVIIFQNQKRWEKSELPEAVIFQEFPHVYPRIFAGNLADPNGTEHLLAVIQGIANRLPHVGEPWPPKWWDIRQELQEIATRQALLDYDEYRAIYQKHIPPTTPGVPDPGEVQLCDYLNDLGVLLHFNGDEALREIIFLRKQWGRTAVSNFMNDAQVRSRHGYFTMADCERIWSEAEYRDHLKLLVQLMARFELCFELRDLSPPTWLATALLSPTPPEVPFERNASDVVLRYQYDVMPRGMITRLMVRKYRYILHPEAAWRQGVVFEDHGDKVLAEIPLAKKEVAFRAQGANARELLIKLAEELETLNDTFAFLKGKVRKLVSCNCATCNDLAEPNSYSYDELIDRRSHHKATIECKFPPYRDVDVNGLLEGYMGLEKPLPEVHAGKRIFISYATPDTAFCVELEKHLQVQRRLGNITLWDMRAIKPSQEWEPEVKRELEQADIVMLLLSADFFNSDYIWEKELKVALQRAIVGECKIAGVVLRPCDWKFPALAKIQMVRKGAPIGAPNQDDAWEEVVEALKGMVAVDG